MLYRRIGKAADVGMTVVDEETLERVPTGGAFTIKGDGCSCYRHDILSRDGMDAQHTVLAPDLNMVVSVTAAEVRRFDLDVIPDPWPPLPDAHPRDAAHALIVNSNGLSNRLRSTAQRQLAAAAVVVLQPRSDSA